MLDLLDVDSVLEREPLQRLAAAGALRAYRHRGFWDCMDTYKDAVVLNDLWSAEERRGSCGAERGGRCWSPGGTGCSAPG